MKYDLEERTTAFGEKVIVFARSIALDEITRPLIDQMVRSGTSIGANYREANEASSKKDFRNKICITKKEANETRHWLRLIMTASPSKAAESKKLMSEVNELVLIFGRIVHTLRETK